LTGRLALFRTILACLVAGTVVGVFFGAEMLYRGLNGIELFPEPEIRPANLFEQYAYSMFRRSSNDVLFYEPNPNARFHKYAVNSHGFRGREVSLEKPEDTFRIVFLGDSIVWGHQLDESETLAGQLESKLNLMSTTKKFEVLNFGVSGYSTQQEVELFVERAQRFEPDFVIVGFCLNDFEESSAEARPFERITLDMQSKSYLLENLNRRVYHLARRYFDIGLMPDFVLKTVDVRREFERLQRHVDSRILVVVFPALTDFKNYPLPHLHADVASSLRGLDVDMIDLLDVFSSYDPAELKVAEDDTTHPNRFANGMVTEQISTYLKRELEPLDLF
jgi:hypothetical protein